MDAATLAFLSGETEQSRQNATKVRDEALDGLDKPGQDGDYWLQATLGEAYLLLGDGTAAHTRYTRAAALARGANKDSGTWSRCAASCSCCAKT